MCADDRSMCADDPVSLCADDSFAMCADDPLSMCADDPFTVRPLASLGCTWPLGSALSALSDQRARPSFTVCQHIPILKSARTALQITPRISVSLSWTHIPWKIPQNLIPQDFILHIPVLKSAPTALQVTPGIIRFEFHASTHFCKAIRYGPTKIKGQNPVLQFWAFNIINNLWMKPFAWVQGFMS